MAAFEVTIEVLKPEHVKLRYIGQSPEQKAAARCGPPRFEQCFQVSGQTPRKPNSQLTT